MGDQLFASDRLFCNPITSFLFITIEYYTPSKDFSIRKTNFDIDIHQWVSVEA